MALNFFRGWGYVLGIIILSAIMMVVVYLVLIYGMLRIYLYKPYTKKDIEPTYLEMIKAKRKKHEGQIQRN